MSAEDTLDAAAKPNFDRIRAVLAENEAKVLNTERAGTEERHTLVAGNAEIWRSWDLPTTDDISTYLDYLTEYTSAANQKASAYVTDPMVSGDKVEGVFRQVAARRLTIGGKTVMAQGLRRVYAPTTAKLLAARPYKKTNENEILEALGLAPGEGDNIAFVWLDINPTSETTLMGLADAGFVTALTATGYTYVMRKFEHLEDNTARFIVALKKVAWNAFDAADPDITTNDNNGTEKQRTSQTWININKGDALTNLYTGASKYNVITVRISEKSDGALVIERTQLKETYGASNSEIEELETDTLNPLGLETGAFARVTIINENLKLKSSAYGTLASGDSGYTLLGYKELLGENGLWSKRWSYIKATWTNTAGSEGTLLPARLPQNGISNPGGYGEGKSKIASGVPIASAAAMLVNIAAETNYTLTEAQWQERGNGEAAFSLQQHRTFPYGTSSVDAPVLQRELLPISMTYIVNQVIVDIKVKQEAKAYFIWRRAAASRISAIVTAAKAIANYATWFTGQYGVAAGWLVDEVDVDHHPDGAADITAIITIPNWGLFTWEHWNTESEIYYVWDYMRDSDGLIDYQIQYGIQTAKRRTETDIIEWLNTMAETYYLVQGSGWSQSGDNKYTGKAIWIEDEIPGPP